MTNGFLECVEVGCSGRSLPRGRLVLQESTLLFFFAPPIALFHLALVARQRDLRAPRAPDQCIAFAHRLGADLGVRIRHELHRFLPNSVAMHLPFEVAWIVWVPSAHQLHRLPAVPVFLYVATLAFLGV